MLSTAIQRFVSLAGQIPMHDAFLSYAREDLELAERLEQAVRTSNKDVWRDLSGIAGGAVYWNRIEGAIAASHYLLFLMTERSLQSMNCKNEIDCAVQNQKKILPLHFRQVRAGQVWEAIAVVQWIYGTDRFDAAVADVVKALNDVPRYRRTHTRLLERAREWSQQERDNTLLLWGFRARRYRRMERRERWPLAGSERIGD